MIILLGSYKGGCGKSTLATSIAAMLASNGADVVLVLADVNGMTAIKPCIHDRKAYRDAICDGKGVTEQPNDKASAEVVAVWEAINGQV